eukprot:463994-Pleurochrysis_carterae.AAC.1
MEGGQRVGEGEDRRGCTRRLLLFGAGLVVGGEVSALQMKKTVRTRQSHPKRRDLRREPPGNIEVALYLRTLDCCRLVRSSRATRRGGARA